MIKSLLLFGLFSASLFLQGCKPSSADSFKIQNEQSPVQEQSGNPVETNNSLPELQKSNSDSQTVNFKSVSFIYNPQIFGEVKSEEVAEYLLQEETFKPDGVAPQHRLFTFDLATGFSEMYIAVYPINDFPRMYAVNKSSVKAQEEEIKEFKKVLKNKNFRVEGQIPYIPFIDASQSFQAKVKHFPFQSGKGILFLTFWDNELAFPSNRQLRYVFEGLTNDGKYYVLAEMPVSVDFLPEDSSDEFEGYKIPQGEEFNSEVVLKRIAEIDKKVAIKLENLPQNEFTPDLKYLEEIISSLKIEK